LVAGKAKTAQTMETSLQMITKLWQIKSALCKFYANDQTRIRNIENGIIHSATLVGIAIIFYKL